MGLIRRQCVHDVFLVLALLSASRASAATLSLGAMVFMGGLALQVWSKGVLVRNSRLCTCGPYAACRHPFYLANALQDLGLCAMSGNLLLLLVYPLAFRVAYAPSIRREEAKLSAIHGATHADYMARTPALLPSLGGFLARPRAPFAWARLLEEREVSRLLRHVSFPLLVVLARRAWTAPAWGLRDMDLALLGAVAGLLYVSVAVYHGPEGRPVAGLYARVVAAVRHGGAAAFAAVLVASTLVLDPDPPDLVLAAGPALLLLGAGAVTREFLATGGPVRRYVLAALLLSSVGAFAAQRLDSVWLAPVGVALALGSVLPPVRPLRAAVPLRGALVASVAGLVSVWACGGPGALSPLPLLQAALKGVALPGDTVLVLTDYDLRRFAGKPGVAAVVGDEQLMDLQRATGTRIVLVAEDEGLQRVRPRLDREPVIRYALRTRMECFYIVTLDPVPALHRHWRAPTVALAGPRALQSPQSG